MADVIDAPPLLRLRGVTKAFNVGTPLETEVLHGIDLCLQRGEFCAVMGPSGSGKSTLLNLVGLLDRPTQGQLEINGVDTGTLDDAALTRLRDQLDSCIGCGCLSMQHCALYNPEDRAAALGAGPRYLLGDRPSALPRSESD